MFFALIYGTHFRALSLARTTRIASARVQLLCIREVGTLRGVRTSFQRILTIFACFFTVFSYFGMVFHRFQGVEKRFQPVLSCFKLILELGSCRELYSGDYPHPESPFFGHLVGFWDHPSPRARIWGPKNQKVQPASGKVPSITFRK